MNQMSRKFLANHPVVQGSKAEARRHTLTACAVLWRQCPRVSKGPRSPYHKLRGKEIPTTRRMETSTRCFIQTTTTYSGSDLQRIIGGKSRATAEFPTPATCIDIPSGASARSVIWGTNRGNMRTDGMRTAESNFRAAKGQR